MTTQTRIARTVAKIAHAGQKYGKGDYFVNHVSLVAESVIEAHGTDDQELIQIAYLHDTLEDTAVTVEDLRELGFTNRVLDAVRLLTKPEGLDYDRYIRRLALSATARKVKLADLYANLSSDPRPSLAARYQKAVQTLTDIEASWRTVTP